MQFNKCWIFWWIYSTRVGLIILFQKIMNVSIWTSPFIVDWKQTVETFSLILFIYSAIVNGFREHIISMPKKKVVDRTWKITGTSGDNELRAHWFGMCVYMCLYLTEVRSHTIYFNIQSVYNSSRSRSRSRNRNTEVHTKGLIAKSHA